MKNKMIVSYYPSCNSKKTTFFKGQSMDGEIYISNGNLVFQKMIFFAFRGNTRLEIPIKSIERVENCILNGFMPYGVCVFTKDGNEYMLGHVQNKKLQDFVMNAKAGVIPEVRKKTLKKCKLTKIFRGILIISLIILFIFSLIMGIKNFIQEGIVKNELAIINTLNASQDVIDMKIKSSGNYAKVEQAMKEYYKDYFDKKKIFNSNRVEVLFNTLTTDYLNENKSKLKSLKLDETIDAKTKELNDSVNSIVEMLESHNIMAYVYKYDLKLYYNNFYRDNMVSKNDSTIQQEWKNLMELNTNKADYLKRIIEILVNNNSSWYVENDTLYFSDDKLLAEYNNLHSMIYDENGEDNSVNNVSI